MIKKRIILAATFSCFKFSSMGLWYLWEFRPTYIICKNSSEIPISTVGGCIVSYIRVIPLVWGTITLSGTLLESMDIMCLSCGKTNSPWTDTPWKINPECVLVDQAVKDQMVLGEVITQQLFKSYSLIDHSAPTPKRKGKMLSVVSNLTVFLIIVQSWIVHCVEVECLFFESE